MTDPRGSGVCQSVL